MPYVVETTATFAWLADVRDARAKRAIAIGLIQLSGGLFGKAKTLGGGLSELRIDIGAGYRAYFVTRQQTIIIMLMGGNKSSQDRDIKTAREMADEL